MATFQLIDVEERPYLYVERQSSMAPDEIGEAMASGFGEVWAFIQKHGVPPADGALAVYPGPMRDRMDYRVGFIVARADMAAADAAVKAATTPAGRVLHFTHRGSYAGIGPAYEAVMARMQTEGLRHVPPHWEVYLNDPYEVPEEQLVTECYLALAD